MHKATISARSGRKSGGCTAFEKHAKPDAESDDFGAVWTQVRRLLRLLEACDFWMDTVGYSGWIQLDTEGGYSGIQWERGPGAGDTVGGRGLAWIQWDTVGGYSGWIQLDTVGEGARGRGH